MSTFKTYLKIVVTAIVIMLGVSVGSLFQSCEEMEDLLSDVQIFTMEYQFIDDDSIAVSTAMALAENKDPLFMKQTDSFIPSTPATGGTGASNQMKMYGDPTTQGSSFSILMERGARSDNKYVRTVAMQSLLGPFHEGQVLTNVQVEVTTGLAGSGKTFNNSQPDTYCKLTITKLNTVSKRIGGEFHFVVRDKDDPQGSDYLSAANGTFTFPY